MHQLHHLHQLVLSRDILVFMKRATMTLPSDLAKAVDDYIQAQEAPPALTTVMQAALREYLRERGFLRQYRPLKITAKGNSGRTDVSQNHDLYLTGTKKGLPPCLPTRAHYMRPAMKPTSTINVLSSN